MAEDIERASVSNIIRLDSRIPPHHAWWISPPENTPLAKIQDELMEAHRRVAEESVSADRPDVDSPVGIYELDLKQFRLIAINEVMCRFMGYTPEEFLSVNPLRFAHPDDQLKLIERTTNLRLGQSVPTRVNFKLLTKKRRTLRARLRITPIYEHGTASRVVVIAEEIPPEKGEPKSTVRRAFSHFLTKLGIRRTASIREAGLLFSASSLGSLIADSEAWLYIVTIPVS